LSTFSADADDHAVHPVAACLPGRAAGGRLPVGPLPEQHQQLDTFAALAAIALERVHYVEAAQDVLVYMESERLRNTLLAALSHDLRTPLTVLAGLSESLMLARPPLPAPQRDIARRCTMRACA
jgi:K+-sensing histidine kinase KdpD